MPKSKRNRKGRKASFVGQALETSTSKLKTDVEVLNTATKAKKEASSKGGGNGEASQLFTALQGSLSSYASRNEECSKYAPAIKRYLRDQFPFFGIKAPPRRSLLKNFVTTFRSELLKFDVLASFLHELWEADEREFQCCGVDLMEQFKDVLLSGGFEEAVGVVRHCLVTKSWWDTVDAISYPVIGYFVKKNPSLGLPLVNEWIDHENMWLRRVAILHQIPFKKETDENLLFCFCLKRAHEEEFFIRKAIGWALRHYSRTNKKAVKEFVSKNKASLSNLSVREALKYCN